MVLATGFSQYENPKAWGRFSGPSSHEAVPLRGMAGKSVYKEPSDRGSGRTLFGGPDSLEMVIRRPSGRMSNIMESLILAQNERWRRVLSMQVERQSST